MEADGLLSATVDDKFVIHKESRLFSSSMKALLPPFASAEYSEQANDAQLSDYKLYNIKSKIVFFLLMNNLMQAAPNLDTVCLKQLRMLSRDQIRQFVMFAATPANKSLAQNIFKCAVRTADSQVVELLLRIPGANIDVNEFIFEYLGSTCTAIELSSFLQSVDVTKILLRNGANVHVAHRQASNTPYWSPRGGALRSMVEGLQWSPRFSRELVSILLDAGANFGQSTLRRILDTRQADLLKFLIQERPEIFRQRLRSDTQSLRDLLILADDETGVYFTRYLIDGHATPMMDNSSLLDAAAEKGNIELAEIFLGQGALVGANTLASAVKAGRIEMAQFLLLKGAIIDKTLMQEAVKNGKREIVALFLEWTPPLDGGLMAIASQNSDSDMIKLLFEAGNSHNSFVDGGSADFVITGVNANEVGYATEKGEIWISYPITGYSEAIRQDNDYLSRIFEANGALLHAREASSFEATLLAAAEKNDIGTVEALLNTGVIVEGIEVGPNFGLRTKHSLHAYSRANRILERALCRAIKHGHEAVFQALVSVGVSLENDAVKATLRKRNKNLALFIVEHGCFDRASVAHEAIEWGDKAVLQKLNINPESERFMHTNLTVAMRREDWAYMEELLKPRMGAAKSWCNSIYEEYDCVVEDVDHHLLVSTCKSAHPRLLRRLLYLGADPSCDALLWQAVSQGRETVQIILEAYLKRFPQGKPEYGWNALCRTVIDSDISLLRLLLSSNLNVNNTVIRSCPCDDLLDSDYEYFDEGRLFGTTPLGIAISDPQVSLQIVEILLDYGADINSVDGENTPALHAAIKAKSLEVVKLLIQRGADVNLPATAGRKRTPLQLAAETGDYDIVLRLINNGARINDTPTREAGGTPLQLAAINGFLGTAWLLLEFGADVNAAPSQVNGRTALEGAAEYGRIDMVQLLHNVGVDIEGPRGLRNGLAIQLARENGHLATVELLESFLPPAPASEQEYDEVLGDYWAA